MSGAPALERAAGLARRGRLYPSVILHGGADAARREAAAHLGRTLLCEREAAARPCGACRHCRRIVTPPAAAPPPHLDPPPPFHPDFAVLWRDDRKTVTGAESTRAFLGAARLAPFEARGQVFVIVEAHTLSAEAGDALLKLLEEPGLGAPRHFLLLAPTRLDLAPTVRSRSLALFLGPAEAVPEETVAELAGGFLDGVTRFARTGHGLYLLEAAARLCAQKPPSAGGDRPDEDAEEDDEPSERAGGGGKKKKTAFDDPRAESPWIAAAAAVRRAADAPELPHELRPPLFALADDLLGEAPPLRLRGIPAERIVAGLVARRLTDR